LVVTLRGISATWRAKLAKAGKSNAVVYAPPTTGFPYLAVLFWRDGSVLRAEPPLLSRRGKS
jgi:hypothetical protein